MLKDKNQLDLLWQFTAPIDSWIMEHISFSKNGWFQKIPIGSSLQHIHENPEDCDIIRYDRTPGRHKTEEDGDALFIIYFYNSHAEFALYDRRESDHKIRLTYEDPTMFDRLDSAIWNARTIDYIYADLKAMEDNLRLIRDGLWDDPQRLIQRSISAVGGIHEKVAELDAHVRKVARRFVRPEDVAKSFNTSKESDQQLWPEDEDDDEIPF